MLAGLNKVEKMFLDAWVASMPGTSIDNPGIRENLRERMVHIAYHEAGHAAANAFLGENYTRFKELSIISNSKTMGRFSQQYTFSSPLDAYPGRLKWVKGQMKMIEDLSGRVAEGKVNSELEDLGSVLGTVLAEAEIDPDQSLSTDEGRAWTTAQIISKPNWPPHRIVSMVEQWTSELFETPQVWAVVESIAKELLTKGTIQNFETLDPLVEPILFGWRNYPKWRRRFNLRNEIVRQRSE